MSLELYARVLWRFRVLVLAGLVAAIVLAGLAMFKVELGGGLPKLTYRQSETWQSTATVLITQDGFPEGRTTLPGAAVPAPGATGVEEPDADEPEQVFAEPGRLSSLALLYAQLANSDPVQAAVERQAVERGVTPGAVNVIALQEPGIGPLPLLSFQGTAASAPDARTTTGAAVDAFKRWVQRSQAGAEILPRDRITLKAVNGAGPAVVTVPRKKTMPIMIFLTVLLVTCGLAFVLENLRPVPLGRRDLHLLNEYSAANAERSAGSGAQRSRAKSPG